MPIKLSIEDFGEFTLKYLVMDLNGTIATNGRLDPEIKPLIELLKPDLDIYILSSDTFGTGSEVANELGVKLHILKNKISGSKEKADFVGELGKDHVVAFGNGRNDRDMLKAARVGIAIMGNEGMARDALLNADLIVTSPTEALSLLLNPQTMRATLRG
ncbi:MAG: HAD family hydrolase [Promethearchaeota archaeon]